jgi:hypothetical protein
MDTLPDASGPSQADVDAAYAGVTSEADRTINKPRAKPPVRVEGM